METYTDYLRRRGEFSDDDPQELALEIEKHWHQYDWEAVEKIDEDRDERAEYWIMICEYKGVTFEGTGIYSCGELIEVQDIEIKH
jgi:hypothetical protein